MSYDQYNHSSTASGDDTSALGFRRGIILYLSKEPNDAPRPGTSPFTYHVAAEVPTDDGGTDIIHFTNGGAFASILAQAEVGDKIDVLLVGDVKALAVRFDLRN